MNRPLKKGDVFILPEGELVTIDSPADPVHHRRLTMVGHIYELEAIGDNERYQLRSAIEKLFHKQKLPADIKLIYRFVNYAARDRAAQTFCIPPGLFLVLHVDNSGKSTSETVYCRRFEPGPGQRCDYIYLTQNSYDTGHFRYEVVRSFTLKTCYPCKTNNFAWKWKAISSPMDRA